VVRILRAAAVTDLIVGDITASREEMDFGRLNELVHNLWSFRELLCARVDACERAGTHVQRKPEQGTFSHCALRGQKVVRPVGSRVWCRNNHQLHADVNGALNLLYCEPEARVRTGGRPWWRTDRWNGHRWVPIGSVQRSGTLPDSPQEVLAA